MDAGKYLWKDRSVCKIKPDKKITERIDVAVTLTLALKRAIRNENHERFFDGRGIIKLLIL